jgi:hypothetical protein
MDKARKPSNSVCYTPSSEPFRIYKHNQFPLRSIVIWSLIAVTFKEIKHRKSVHISCFLHPGYIDFPAPREIRRSCWCNICCSRLTFNLLGRSVSLNPLAFYDILVIDRIYASFPHKTLISFLSFMPYQLRYKFFSSTWLKLKEKTKLRGRSPQSN